MTQQIREVLKDLLQGNYDGSDYQQQALTTALKILQEYEELKLRIEELEKNAKWKIEKLEYKLKRYEEVYLADCDKGLLHKILNLQSQIKKLEEKIESLRNVIKDLKELEGGKGGIR